MHIFFIRDWNGDVEQCEPASEFGNLPCLQHSFSVWHQHSVHLRAGPKLRNKCYETLSMLRYFYLTVVFRVFSFPFTKQGR